LVEHEKRKCKTLNYLVLTQRGPTTFDLRAILQKCYNLWATSNKMMHKTDSHSKQK